MGSLSGWVRYWWDTIINNLPKVQNGWKSSLKGIPGIHSILCLKTWNQVSVLSPIFLSSPWSINLERGYTVLSDNLPLFFHPFESLNLSFFHPSIFDLMVVWFVVCSPSWHCGSGSGHALVTGTGGNSWGIGAEEGSRSPEAAPGPMPGELHADTGPSEEGAPLEGGQREEGEKGLGEATRNVYKENMT